MTTIKGPIHIKNGFNARKFLEEKAKDVKVRLPFSATGWKSDRNADLVTGGVKEVEEVKEVKKTKVKPKKKKFF